LIRKILNISIVFLLLLSTNGVVIFKHYCCGSLVKQTINVLPDNCCTQKCKHCHNEAKQIKVNDDFVANNTNLNIKPPVKPVTFCNFSIKAFIVNYTGYNLLRNLIKLIPKFSGNLPIRDAVTLFQVYRL